MTSLLCPSLPDMRLGGLQQFWLHITQDPKTSLYFGDGTADSRDQFSGGTRLLHLFLKDQLESVPLLHISVRTFEFQQ